MSAYCMQDFKVDNMGHRLDLATGTQISAPPYFHLATYEM